MSNVPRQSGRQPPSMQTCPRCGGTGRVGRGRAPCQACWCSGQVEGWQRQQMLDEDARRNRAAARAGAGEAEEADEPTDVARIALRPEFAGPCVKCGPIDRCPQCPFGPFVLAA
jgi:DnaJ-class molecular chaperone